MPCSWPWMRNGLRCVLLGLVFAAGGATAQAPDAAARWQTLHAWALEAYQLGAYADGIAAAESALAMARDAFGPRHPDTLISMNNLAVLYRSQGRYGEAEPLLREALQHRREALGARHPDTLQSMNDLAVLYRSQGRYGEAEPLLREALQLRREALGARHPNTLDSLNNLAVLGESQGRYGEAEPLFREALQLSREVLGPRHPDTLGRMNNLAVLYRNQGRYGEAEPLLLEALPLMREVLGSRHPSTLSGLINLAGLYYGQGRTTEAEPLFLEALQLSREVLGPRHPSTLLSVNNLAVLYQGQGRYGEAEPLFREALQLSREVLGPRHPNTLANLHNLGGLYRSQGRYGEAEPPFREALQVSREVLGPRHPNTLLSLINLASVYWEQGRYAEAEPLFREVLQLSREVLGPRHPNTLLSLNNLAVLYDSQGRYGEAEPLLREALQLRREVLGERHFDTLQSMNNLSFVYRSQGRYGEAEPLFREALQLSREVLGPRHPIRLVSLVTLATMYWDQGRHSEAEPLLSEALAGARATLGAAHPHTLLYQLNGAVNLAALGRIGDAGQQLRAMEPQLLIWLGAELYSSEAAGVRNRLVASQATYQHARLSLALLPGAGAAEEEGAASAVLRFKGLQAEEEAYLARVVRRGQDPRARQLAGEIAGLRTQLAALFHGAGKPEEVAALARQLEAQELALGRVSRAYQQHLQVRNTSLDDLRATLQPGRALLELRAYQPVNFHTGELGKWRWAGLLITGGAVRMRDLGPAEDTAAQTQALLGEPDGEAGRQAAAALHAQLLGPFAAELVGLEGLHVAPDGALNLVPFAALRGPDGKRLAEVLDLRLLQTGRDLLRPDPDRPAKGLLALGGIDFGAGGLRTASAEPIRRNQEDPPRQLAAAAHPSEPPLVVGGVSAAEVQERTREALPGDFGPLQGTAEEAEQIAERYRRARRDEAVEVWKGAEASEARLRALPRPPRVLHLATHGFYRPATKPQDRPLLLAGVALAGANAALRQADQDGILYAIEAQDLDLEGTELVVLSACETAQGQIDYGEGVSGLVRALRTAGARNVLVTLRPVADRGAAAFMGRFYHHWLGQAGRSDPAAALRAAQQDAIKDIAQGTSTDQTWAQFVLVGG